MVQAPGGAAYGTVPVGTSSFFHVTGAFSGASRWRLPRGAHEVLVTGDQFCFVRCRTGDSGDSEVRACDSPRERASGARLVPA